MRRFHFAIVIVLFTGISFMLMVDTATAHEEPDIEISPQSPDVGTISNGSSTNMTLTITNNGEADLTVIDVSVTGMNVTESKVSMRTFTLFPGESRKIDIIFRVSSSDNKAPILEVVSDDPDESTVTVALSDTNSIQANEGGFGSSLQESAPITTIVTLAEELGPRFGFMVIIVLLAVLFLVFEFE